MLNQKTRSPQLETRAVEESFSWAPQSRKAFLREVPLLSSRAHLGAQKWAVPFRKKNTALVRGGGGGGGGGGEQDFDAPLPHSPNPLEEAKLHRWSLGLIYGGGFRRWGIEGIRIGTFGRGRGEYGKSITRKLGYFRSVEL